jgi:hypothetical protein
MFAVGYAARFVFHFFSNSICSAVKTTAGRAARTLAIAWTTVKSGSRCINQAAATSALRKALAHNEAKRFPGWCVNVWPLTACAERRYLD